MYCEKAADGVFSKREPASMRRNVIGHTLVIFSVN